MQGRDHSIFQPTGLCSGLYLNLSPQIIYKEDFHFQTEHDKEWKQKRWGWKAFKCKLPPSPGSEVRASYPHSGPQRGRSRAAEQAQAPKGKAPPALNSPALPVDSTSVMCLYFCRKNIGEFPISQTCFGNSCREMSKSMPSATFFIKGNTERTGGNTSSPLTSPLPSLQDSWNTDFNSYTTSLCCQRRDETIPRRTIHASQPPDRRGHPGALMGFWFWAIPSNSIWKRMGSLA